MTTPMTLDLKEETASALQAFAARLERHPAELASEVLEDWLAFQRRQAEKIEEGLAAADRAEFVPREEIERIVNKHRTAR